MGAGRVAGPDRGGTSGLQEHLDRLAVMDLVRAERERRDAGLWEELADCYDEGATVRVSWFTGDAADFVRASRQRAGHPARSVHHVGLPSVRLAGDRAVANTPCTLYIDRVVDGIDCEVVCLFNHQSRAVRRADGWRLGSFVAIYKKDFLLVRQPGAVLAIDDAELGAYRTSYRYLSLSRGARGQVPDQTLPGVDRPDLVQALTEADEAWLCGEDRPVATPGASGGGTDDEGSTPGC